jgi:hypothetical protein
MSPQTVAQGSPRVRGPQGREGPRYGVLTIVQGLHPAYVIVDTWLVRLVDGVYGQFSLALGAAAWYEQRGCPGDRAPSSAALCLAFPPGGVLREDTR